MSRELLLRRCSRFLGVTLVVATGCGGGQRNEPGETGSAHDGGGPTTVEQVGYPCVGPVQECGDTGLKRPVPGPGPRCPSGSPREGDACSLSPAETCTYGESRTALCRDLWVCEDEQFTQAPTVGENGCAEWAEQHCPDEAPVHGSECTGAEVLGCEYDENVTCFCSSLEAAAGLESPGRWACEGPSTDERCPVVLPNLGASCNEPGLRCVYVPNVCLETQGSNVFCFDGAWQADSWGSCGG